MSNYPYNPFVVPARRTESTGSLLSKVSMLLVPAMGLSALGSYMGRNITGGAAPWILIGVFFIGAITLRSVLRKAGPAAGIAMFAAWTFVTGLMLGPVLAL